MFNGWQGTGELTADEHLEARRLIKKGKFPQLAKTRIADDCWERLLQGSSYKAPRPDTTSAEELARQTWIFIAALQLAIKENKTMGEN